MSLKLRIFIFFIHNDECLAHRKISVSEGICTSRFFAYINPLGKILNFADEIITLGIKLKDVL